MFRNILSLVIALMLFPLVSSVHAEEKNNRYNVLFIAVDDLRPELGCYGVSEVKSPNIDQLAKSGLVFNHHYVQVPTCGSSRHALLTGRRPTISGGMGNHASIRGKSALKREQLAGAQSMPELFRRSGYHTVCIGKISHSPDGKLFSYNGTGGGRHEIPNAWDELPTPYGQWKYGWGCFFAYGHGASRETPQGKNKERPVYQFPNVPDNGLPDGMMCDKALKVLGELKAKGKPFFLGVGFYKPHLPFVAPAEYRKLYDSVDVKPAKNQQVKKTAFWHDSGEFYGYTATHKKTKPLAVKDQIACKKAYYACVSYIDAQIGRLIKKVKDLGLEKDTVIVIWGDHGWHLGDHAIWGKHSPLERANRSPLIIKVPGMAMAGKSTDAVVETLDIYPTLIDLCKPVFSKLDKPLDGVSLAPVLANAKHPGKDCAISYWGSTRSVRTKRYRLIATVKGGEPKAVELYDHYSDPEEMSGIAIETRKDAVQALLAKVKQDKPVMLSDGNGP